LFIILNIIATAVPINPEHLKGMEDAYNLITQANNDMITLWLKYTFLTWQWWLGVFLSIAPWMVWIIVRKKDSTDRLLLAGLLAMLISSWFDILGIIFGLWSYYYGVVPFSPAFVPWDFTLLPVTIMLSLQYKFNMGPIKRAIAFAAVSSFIIEPFFVWIGFYNLKHWHFMYSFPIIIIIYLLCDWFSKMSRFEKKPNK
jgi:hypothetical protein